MNRKLKNMTTEKQLMIKEELETIRLKYRTGKSYCDLEEFKSKKDNIKSDIIKLIFDLRTLKNMYSFNIYEKYFYKYHTQLYALCRHLIRLTKWNIGKYKELDLTYKHICDSYNKKYKYKKIVYRKFLDLEHKNYNYENVRVNAIRYDLEFLGLVLYRNLTVDEHVAYRLINCFTILMKLDRGKRSFIKLGRRSLSCQENIKRQTGRYNKNKTIEVK